MIPERDRNVKVAPHNIGMPPLYWITGAPAAGKTTVSRTLLQHFEFGLHIPVDDMRTWVVSGLSESVNWTDETTRQFSLAEASACAVAREYHEAGFAVAIDHCRNLARIDEIIATHLTGLAVRKVCLIPDLVTNLKRNHERTNKNFDPRVLDFIIEGMNPSLRIQVPAGWHLLDSTGESAEETVARILEI